MRHGKKFNHLGRTSAHRKAMLSNMASSLIIHKRINTTVAKAKALKKYVEPLITKSKNDSTHSRRVVFSYLQNKEAVSELFREISQKIADRPGGYTRILKTGNRLGDNAEMCMVELVDYNEILLAEKDDKKVKTTRRRRRSSGKKKTSEEAQKAVVDTTTEVIEEVAETQQEVKVEEEIKEPKAEKPKAEEPKAEEPKAEEPKAEKPKSEEPKSEEKDEEEKQ